MPPHSANISSGFLIPRLRQPALSRDSTLSGAPDGASLQQRIGCTTPTSAVQTAKVWLESAGSHFRLLPYFDGPLLVLLLFADDTVISRDIISSVTEVRG